MRKKKLSTEKPNLPKEYIWKLEVEDRIRVFKCLVTETECITYADGAEQERLTIEDPTCLEGTLQIDSKVKLFDEVVEFQLERFIPYIRLDGHWSMSDTTEEDRMQAQLRLHNRNSKIEVVSGTVALAAVLAKRLITGDIGDWWMLSIFGIFFFFSAISRTVRLKQEIDAIRDVQKRIDERLALQNQAIEE